MFLEIGPLILPSPKESMIELRVDEISVETAGHYLFPITY